MNRLALPIACASLIVFWGVCLAQESAHLETRPTWRVQWANDALLDSDNQFTNGLTIQKHSSIGPSLARTGGTPAFGRFLARHVLPDRPELFYRETWAVAHNMHTPDDKRSEELVPDDVPYSGMIGVSNAFIAYNDRELTGLQLLLGWVGPRAFAEDVQRIVHELNGSVKASGWDNQLDDEPILNLHFTRKRKLWRTTRFDGAWSLDAALGNLFTFGQAGIETRFGRVPDGFAPLPTPMGRGLDYDARLAERGSRYLYGSFVLSASRFLFSLPREGNIFRNDGAWTQLNEIRPKEYVGQAILGGHFEREKWALHLNYWFSTDTFEPDMESELEELDDSFGVLSFEWRFD